MTWQVLCSRIHRVLAPNPDLIELNDTLQVSNVASTVHSLGPFSQGRAPTLLQRLPDLPFEYYSSPDKVGRCSLTISNPR